MNHDDVAAVEAIINEHWRQRFSAGAMNTETGNFLHGLKEELLKDVRALAPEVRESAEEKEAEGR